MKDSNSLAYYNINKGAVISLQLKERGGRKKQTSYIDKEEVGKSRQVIQIKRRSEKVDKLYKKKEEVGKNKCNDFIFVLCCRYIILLLTFLYANNNTIPGSDSHGNKIFTGHLVQ